MKATSRAPRIIGRIVKSLFVLLILAVNAIIVWRILFSDKLPERVDALTPNAALSAAAAQYGDGLILQYQEQATVTKGGRSYGYFGIPEAVFIPEANQVQIVFRYNNSTLKNVARDYGLPDTPDKAAHLFDVTLVRTVDLTPTVSADNADPDFLDTVRYFPTEASVVRDTTKLYTYYRYVFEGVTVDAGTVGVFADVYYVGDVNYEKEAYGTLCLYDREMPWLPYKTDAKDRRALGLAD